MNGVNLTFYVLQMHLGSHILHEAEQVAGYMRRTSDATSHMYNTIYIMRQ